MRTISINGYSLEYFCFDRNGLAPYITVHSTGKRLAVSFGSQERFSVYEHKIGNNKVIVVLSYSEKYGYAGLEVYQMTGEKISDCFIQNTEELGENFFELSDINKAKQLMAYMVE